jgi:hypothetical protein
MALEGGPAPLLQPVVGKMAAPRGWLKRLSAPVTEKQAETSKPRVPGKSATSDRYGLMCSERMPAIRGKAKPHASGLRHGDPQRLAGRIGPKAKGEVANAGWIGHCSTLSAAILVFRHFHMPARYC